MKKRIVLLTLGAGLFVSSPALGATTINLDATDFSKSSQDYAFGTGRFEVSLIADVYKAWSARDITRPENTVPWVDYFDYTINGVTTRFNPLNGQRFASADAALAAYSASGPRSLIFTVPTTVKFSIADYPTSFHDNSGGVSLGIAAVPEPATWGMMLVGFFLTGVAMRRRQRGGRPVLAG